MVMSDFNSKIGNNRRVYEDVMGEFGLGVRNERGQRMLEFCRGKQLCITNTYFYHREHDRYTSTHPDGIHRKCIDCILINKRWKTSVRGTKVMRGADFGTSHELLLSNIRNKLRTDRGRNQELVRYNLEKLRNEEVETAFKLRVGGRFEPLKGLETTEEKWCRGRDIIKEEADSILGRRRRAKQQQALNSIWREGMIRILKEWGLEPKILETIRRLYERKSIRVRKGKCSIEEFITTGGVILGCPLSPHLFNLYLEWVMRMALGDYEGGIDIGGTKISNMRYAFDMVLLAETKEELQRVLRMMEE
ncbi:craniofacial development protein 2-like [Palaemon carinicauda]|uniref:craniofacial development protein 2-like n=1 Tax=Palaemon carinicauda TaxID=392227 RepID=UPI0035B64B2D